MAAATPLSPEDLLLAKGATGKAEELEEEMTEEDDDEEVTSPRPSCGVPCQASPCARGRSLPGGGLSWSGPEPVGVMEVGEMGAVCFPFAVGCQKLGPEGAWGSWKGQRSWRSGLGEEGEAQSG